MQPITTKPPESQVSGDKTLSGATEILNVAQSTVLTSAQSNMANPATRILTVEELNKHIRQLIEGSLSLVWIQGEISNFKAHPSGHFYFSLKDSKSQISAVMFRGHNSRLKFKPVDGLEVIIRGRVTVYEPRGNYQILCEQMEPVGAGALQKAYEQLKEKLKLEGLFETSRKRPIPAFVKKIAVITSPSGAAVHDIVTVLGRRNRMVEIFIIPTIVQGEAAPPQIIKALELAYKMVGLDAIIVGRGGGSLEDLWCFNDEAVARKISTSPIPIISAVGHEVDFTIADFVADLRAPTPSAAAELIAKNSGELTQTLLNLGQRLRMSWAKTSRATKQRIIFLSSHLVDPKRSLIESRLRNDELLSRLGLAQEHLLESLRLHVRVKTQSLVPPALILAKLRSRTERLQLRLNNNWKSRFNNWRNQIKSNVGLLDGMSPLRVLNRGYAVAKLDGQVLASVNQVTKKQEIEVWLADGIVKSQVTDITHKKIT